MHGGDTAKFKGSNKIKIAGLNNDVYGWITSWINNNKVGNKTWSAVLSPYVKDTANKTYRRYFMCGCALHILGDIFAHSTLHKSTSAEIKHNSQNFNVDADNTAYVPNRFNVAKRAVGYSLYALTSSVYGDYLEIESALDELYNNTWVKKKLAAYAKSNSQGGYIASIFNKASK